MSTVAGVELTREPEGRQAEVLTPEALDVRRRPARALQRPPARAAAPRAAERRARLAAGERSTSCPRRARSARATGRSRRRRPDLRDRRVEITGPVDRKMVINALNSGARGFMADFEDSLSPTWANVVDGQVNLTRRDRGHDRVHGPDGREYRLGEETATLLVRPRGWHLPDKHVLVDGTPVAGGAARRRAATSSTTPGACSTRGVGPVLLPAQDGEPPRGAAVERRLRPRRGRARPRPRHDPRDGAHRDAARGVRDGGDPLRAARALRGPERRALGLHLQRHQDVPRAARVRAARPRRREDDRAVHARLRRAAGEDLPPPRRPRDGRHGGADPSAARTPEANEKAIAAVRADKEREAGDGLRRHVGRPPRRRRRGARASSTRCSASAPTRSTASATTSRSARTSCSTSPPRPGAITEAGPAQRRQRRHPVHLVVAARQRRGRRSTA